MAGTATSELAETSRLVPSGAARATMSLPIMPLAPALFSTMTVVPVTSRSLSAMMRAVTSMFPPGA